MASPPPRQGVHRYACSLCARRKIKCDKGDPCANCIKAQARCVYDAPAPHRPRKRAGDEELLNRLALYEDLMRKHNIDFSHCANTWMPSALEPKLKDNGPRTPVSIISATSRPDSKSYASEDITANVEQCLWSNLSSELKYPPIQSLRHKYDPHRYSTPPLRFTFPSDQPELYELHPEPKHIYQLWQVFVEKINPITKVVHVPTLQQRILNAGWDPSKASKPLTAIMFAIYTLAITPMSANDCQTSFGETRDTLLTRYRAATVQALVAADFLLTRELDVLQALVLFLFADPESELTCTLTGAAIRVCQKMSLHRESTSAKISCFGKEMFIRAWWQLRCLDSRSRALSNSGLKPPPPSEFGDVRLPLNVNDADLHPDMAEPPMEQNGPTEMLCVLLKFEVLNWLRSSPKAARICENIIQGSLRGNMSTELQDEAINELEAVYQEKYLLNCDKKIPLHILTHAIANFTVSRMRFKVHHPRWRAVASGGEVYMTREESDVLFDSALTTLEMVDASIHGKLASHLFIHMTFTFQLDAYIYVLSELRRRCAGDRVALAWRLVEDLYTEHPELIDDAENTFFVALGDLTLEAWEARRRELASGPDATESSVTPQFVWLLLDKRGDVDEEHAQMPTFPDPYGLNGFVLPDDASYLNGEYWNDFLQI